MPSNIWNKGHLYLHGASNFVHTFRNGQVHRYSGLTLDKVTFSPQISPLDAQWLRRHVYDVICELVFAKCYIWRCHGVCDSALYRSVLNWESGVIGKLRMKSQHKNINKFQWIKAPAVQMGDILTKTTKLWSIVCIILSQWERTLQSNAFSHWLSPYPEWSLFLSSASMWCHIGAKLNIHLQLDLIIQKLHYANIENITDTLHVWAFVWGTHKWPLNHR